MKQKILAGISGVIGVILIIVGFVMTASREQVIIEYGILTYRNLARMAHVLQIIGVILVVIAVLVILLGVARAKKAQEEAVRRAVEEEERRRHEEADLSVRDQLVPERMQSLLKEQRGQWPDFTGEINQCIMQMIQMDDYQKKLDELLVRNDAAALSETGDVLNKVEQYLCRNVRKVLNVMQISSQNDQSARLGVRDALLKCAESNGESLHSVQEFLFALTEYLNRQGEDGNEMATLNLYRNEIMKTIQS